jgi:hypothetical protein
MFNFRFNTERMLQILAKAWTGGDVESYLHAFGLRVPAMAVSFYIGNESAEYILTAALACSQIGD